MTDDPSSPPDLAAQDLAWMQRVKAGDLEAFRELVEAHQHRIIGTVAKMLSDETDAEDIAQQVFVRVWKSAHRWEPTAKVTTWLFKITRNLVFNELRRRMRHPVTSLDRKYHDEEGDHPMQVEDTSVKRPDDALLNDEMQAAIQSAIEALPEVQRMAIILRRYDDVPYEEIGEILGLSVPAVKSVLFRARADLRERLRRYLEG